MSKSKEIKDRALNILVAKTINNEDVSKDIKEMECNKYNALFTYPSDVKWFNGKIITPAKVMFDPFEDKFVGLVDVYTAKLGRVGSNKVYLYKKVINVIFSKDNARVSSILDKYNGDIDKSLVDICQIFASAIEYKAAEELGSDEGGIKVIVGDEVKSAKVFTLNELRKELSNVDVEPTIEVLNSNRRISLSEAEANRKEK